MLKRTHLVIGLTLGLYFLPLVTHKLFFIPVVLISSLLPDIDSASSTFGERRIFRPLQWVTQHRGPFHSYTFCVAIAVILAFFYPIYALPFFLGYSFHLFADGFTPRGIRPFYPLKFHTSGVVKTGGKVDKALFVAFLFLDILLVFFLFAQNG